MNKSLLKEVILEQKNIIDDIDIGISRESLSQIEKYLKLPHSIIVSGIRRSGKSTLMSQIIKKFYGKNAVNYLNFEDERLINFELADFNKLYELFIELFGEKKIFFFDEIQNVQNWEAFVRRMQDRKCKFFITGSNASLLSKELGTKLTGRSVTVELFPFSFKEFLSFKGYKFVRNNLLLTQERGEIKKYFNEYIRKGSMPEYLKYKDTIVLKKVYEDILYRDIVARYEIKEIKILRELSLYLLSNVGNLFSYNKLKSFFKLGSMNTIKSYIGYLEDSFLFFTVKGFSSSLKKQMVSPQKIYCIDNGLINTIAFRFSKDKGKFLENLVFGELKRRGKEVYYYKTKNNLEVDFLIKEGIKIDTLIQVTQTLSGNKVREREIKALVLAMDELKLKKGLILTEDEEEEIKVKNKTITVIPVYKWLLI
ncbi:ATP-binding protein [bacterium]|nr:ATP-binding protein [bacterium]